MSALRKWLQWHSVYSHIAAPIWLRIPEETRWRIVDWLNKSRRRCWPDLVAAAIAYHWDDYCNVHFPRLSTDRAPHCASVCDWMHPDHAGIHPCRCYCGKFQFTATDGALERQATR